MNRALILVLILVCNIRLIGAEFPSIDVIVQNDPSPGYYLIGPYSLDYLCLIDNGGHHIFDTHISGDGQINAEGISDFKVHSNGKITYFNTLTNIVYQIDLNFNVIDSFMCNGYINDMHDFQFLSNGNSLQIGIDTEYVDMSSLVNNGCKNALIQGFVLQEQECE